MIDHVLANWLELSKQGLSISYKGQTGTSVKGCNLLLSYIYTGVSINKIFNSTDITRKRKYIEQ